MHSLSPVFCHSSHLPSCLINNHDGNIGLEQVVQKCSLCSNPTAPRESCNIGVEFLEELKLMSHALMPASGGAGISGQSTRSGSDASSIGGKEDVFIPLGLSVALSDHRGSITNEAHRNNLGQRSKCDSDYCLVQECMPCPISLTDACQYGQDVEKMVDGGNDGCGIVHGFKEERTHIPDILEHPGGVNLCGVCSSQLDPVAIEPLANPQMNADCAAIVQSSGDLQNISRTLIASSQRASKHVFTERIFACAAAAETGTASCSSGRDYMCVSRPVNEIVASRDCEPICRNNGVSAEVFSSDTGDTPPTYDKCICSCDMEDEKKNEAEIPTYPQRKSVDVFLDPGIVQNVSGPPEQQQHNPPIRGDQEHCKHPSDNSRLDSSNKKYIPGRGKKAGGDGGGDKGDGDDTADDRHVIQRKVSTSCGEAKALLAACNEYTVLDPEEDSLAVETMWHLEAIFTSIDPNSTFRIHGPLKYALATRYLAVEVSWNTTFPPEFALAELSVHLRKMRYLFKCELLKTGPRSVSGNYQACDTDDAMVGENADFRGTDDWDMHLVRTGNSGRSEMEILLAQHPPSAASPVLRVMDTVGGRVYDVTVSNATSCAISSLLSRYMRSSPIYSRLCTLLIIWAARRVLPVTAPQYTNGSGQVNSARHQVRTTGNIQPNGSPANIVSSLMIMVVHFLQSYTDTSFPTSTSLLMDKDLLHWNFENHDQRGKQFVAGGQIYSNSNRASRDLPSCSNHRTADENFIDPTFQSNTLSVDEDQEATAVTNLFWKFFVFYAKILVPSKGNCKANNILHPYLVCMRHRLNRLHVELDGDVSEFPKVGESTGSNGEAYSRKLLIVRDPFVDRDLAADFTPLFEQHFAVEICRAARLAPSHELSNACELRRGSSQFQSCTDGNVSTLLSPLPGLAANINVEAIMAVGVVSVNNSVSQSRGTNPSLNVDPLSSSKMHSGNSDGKSTLFHENGFEELNFDAAWHSAENVECRLRMRGAHVQSYRDMQKQLELSNTLQGLLAEKLRVYRNEVWWLERKLDSQLQANPNPFSKPSSAVPFAQVGHSAHVRPPNLSIYGRRTSTSQHQPPGSFYQSAIHNSRRAAGGSASGQNVPPGSNPSAPQQPLRGKQLQSGNNTSPDNDLNVNANSMHPGAEYNSSGVPFMANRKQQPPSHQQPSVQQHGGNRRSSQTSGNMPQVTKHIPVEDTRRMSGRDCVTLKKGSAFQPQHDEEYGELHISDNKDGDKWAAKDYNRNVSRPKGQDTFTSGRSDEMLSSADHSGNGQYSKAHPLSWKNHARTSRIAAGNTVDVRGGNGRLVQHQNFVAEQNQPPSGTHGGNGGDIYGDLVMTNLAGLVGINEAQDKSKMVHDGTIFGPLVHYSSQKDPNITEGAFIGDGNYKTPVDLSEFDGIDTEMLHAVLGWAPKQQIFGGAPGFPPEAKEEVFLLANGGDEFSCRTTPEMTGNVFGTSSANEDTDRYLRPMPQM